MSLILEIGFKSLPAQQLSATLSSAKNEASVHAYKVERPEDNGAQVRNEGHQKESDPMPRTFTIEELRSLENVAAWAFFCALSKVPEFDTSKVSNEDGTVTITFKAGETDLDFGFVINRMNEMFEREVNKRAKELLQERLNDFQTKVYDMCDRIENCVKDETMKAFPDFQLEDED